tara:strand:- start:811 stop:1740 length:930 start_codon:yes stop_codon:yes gene_type:complete
MISNYTNDLDYLNSSLIYKVNPNRIDETLDTIKNKIKEKTTLTSFDEIFTQRNEFEKLQKFCLEKQKEGIEVKILTSSLKEIENGFNPIVNFLCWSNTTYKNETKENSLHFNLNNFINFPTKNKKFILSWRKDSKTRTELLSGIEFESIDSIIKYHNINPYNLRDINNQPKEDKKYVSWEFLINNYKSSLISFICETEYWIENAKIICNDVIPFTEKIILPLLTKTLPIVFAPKDYNEYLNNIGFFTLNEEYGINGTDILEYNNCIKKIQSQSFNDVKKIYDKYQKEIDNNYKLIIDIINYPKLKIINE